MDDGTSPTTIPKPALFLGIGGALPFVACAVSLAGLHVVADALAWRSLQAYAALVLSFLGAVHWGAAIVREQTAGFGKSLGLSVLPCLLGWLVLSNEFPPGGSLALLMFGFAGQFAADRVATDRGLLPPWYLDLRRVLSVVVLGSLGVVLVLGSITSIGR